MQTLNIGVSGIRFSVTNGTIGTYVQPVPFCLCYVRCWYVLHLLQCLAVKQPVLRPGAGFMNRRRLCQLTAAISTSDLTTHMWVL